MTWELYGHQETAVDDIRAAYSDGFRAPLLCAPTGSGKTVLFTYIAAHAAEKGNRVMLLVHRRELLQQVSRALTRWGVEHGMIAPGVPEELQRRVQVAMVLTLAKRIRKRGPAPYMAELVVIDECHHAIQGSAFGVVIGAQDPAVRLLGVTATPCRLDGRGLGATASGHFDRLIMGPSYADLIGRGYLAKLRVWRGERPNLDGIHSRGGDFVTAELAERMAEPRYTGNAIAEYQRRCPGRSAIVFCVNVRHAEVVARDFARAGYRAACLTGKTPDAERDALLRDLGTGALQVLTSCDVISEGTDVPAVVAGILLRPTKSLCKAWQQIGRVLRVCEGKDYAVVLDHAGNIARHGLPTDRVVWSLEDGARREAVQDPYKECPACGLMCEANELRCECCGYVWTDMAKQCPRCERWVRKTVMRCWCGYRWPGRPGAMPRGNEMELIELPLDECGRRIEIAFPWQATCYEQLVVLGIQRGYAKPKGWAWHTWESYRHADAKRQAEAAEGCTRPAPAGGGDGGRSDA